VAAVALPWDERQADPVATLAAARAIHGDTFVVDSGADRYLFLLSPEGVRGFYAVPEDDASKGVADWRMLRRKLPDELFAGRRTLPDQLFGRHDVVAYLDHLDTALDRAVAELGGEGELDVFAFARRLAHRMGLAAWGGPGSADGERFEALVVALDVLDASEAFVRPDLMAAVEASGKAGERQALERSVALVGAALVEHDAHLAVGTADPADLFSRIASRWADEAPGARAEGVAGDVVLVHLASMSNLFAALGWSLVDVARRPEVLARVRADEPGLVERCALESIRRAQRSIMLRHVLRPVEVPIDATTTVRVEPGATLATLLPLTNSSAAPGLDRWDPDRWRGRRLGPHVGLATPELVTTFGHGSHTCPAQPFSLSALARTVRRLATAFALDPVGPAPVPLAAQIGGVARAAAPTLLRYWPL
jgi:cytochrome P450